MDIADITFKLMRTSSTRKLFVCLLSSMFSITQFYGMGLKLFPIFCRPLVDEKKLGNKFFWCREDPWE